MFPNNSTREFVQLIQRKPVLNLFEIFSFTVLAVTLTKRLPEGFQMDFGDPSKILRPKHATGMLVIANLELCWLVTGYEYVNVKPIISRNIY